MTSDETTPGGSPAASAALYEMPAAEELARRMTEVSRSPALAAVREAAAADLAGRSVTGTGAANALVIRYTEQALAAGTDDASARGEVAHLLSAILASAPESVLEEALRHLARVAVASDARSGRTMDGRRPPPDVVVLSTAGLGYVLTDSLREAGLSVGAELVPPRADRDRVRDQVARDLADPDTVAAWRPATLVVSMFHPCTPAADIEDLVDRALARGRTPGSEPLWLQLSPVPHRSPGRDVVHAPLTLSTLAEEVYLATPTRRLIAQELSGRRALRNSAYRCVLRALLALPMPPLSRRAGGPGSQASPGWAG